MTQLDSVRGVDFLECTGTGDVFEGEQLIGLSPAGKPLLARYDLAAIRESFTPEEVGSRRADPLAIRGSAPGS